MLDKKDQYINPFEKGDYCKCPYSPKKSGEYPDFDGDYYHIDASVESSSPAEICSSPVIIRDYGPEPYVTNIKEATLKNSTFRTALWTGRYLQLTLMSIQPGDDIGLEVHYQTDQFIRIEKGSGLVKMGDWRDKLDFQRNVCEGDVIFIPAGKWHNLINTGKTPLKLYSIYAPPNHPRGTVHKTKKDAMEEEKHLREK